MNSIQIGSAASAPCSWLPSDFLLVEPDPDADGDVRIEADEPGVGVVVDRAGLAGERPLRWPCSPPAMRRAAHQHAAQQVRHHERGVGADDVARLGAVLLEQVAVAILHVDSTANGFIRTP